MIKRFLILALLLIAVPCWGATYNFYFSSEAQGNPVGTDNPVALTDCVGPVGVTAGTCETLADAQAMIELVRLDSSAHVVNLYFDRGDTWSYDTGTLEDGDEVFYVENGDPQVHINAYGSGGDPIFDGLETDFTATNASNCGVAAPCSYSVFFRFAKQNCSIQNVEIKRVYGKVIVVGGGSDPFYDADGFILRNSYIHDFGSDAISIKSQVGAENITVEYNVIHSGQRLRLEGGKSSTSWGAGINLESANHGSSSMCKDNIIKYNLVYDISGEGINAPNSTTMYNVVGDTYSIAIGTSAHDYDTLTAVVAYNLILGSSAGTYGRATAIRVYDEAAGGDNSAADISVYGNIIINRNYGLRAYCSADCDPYGSVKFYNNTVIDSLTESFRIKDVAAFPTLAFYNNISVFYDNASDNIPHRLTDSDDTSGWSISNNLYYATSGTHTIDDDFQNNYVTTDPTLPGNAALDFGALASVAYAAGVVSIPVDYTTQLYPVTGDTIQGGYDHAFEQTFLTTGTDFENVLNGSSAFTEAEQHLTLQDIGSWARGTSEPVPTYPLQGVAGNFKYN